MICSMRSKLLNKLETIYRKYELYIFCLLLLKSKLETFLLFRNNLRFFMWVIVYFIFWSKNSSSKFFLKIFLKKGLHTFRS